MTRPRQHSEPGSRATYAERNRIERHTAHDVARRCWTHYKYVRAWMQRENKRIVFYPLTLSLIVLCGFALPESGLISGLHSERDFSLIRYARAGPARDDAVPAATWSVDPRVPGASLPPIGRSLFDFLMTEDVDGKKTYRVPFPFEALTQKVEAALEKDASGRSPLKQVLIPLGRSLQRNAASPQFFKYPRVLVAVDTGPVAQHGYSGMLLKDRLYLGYLEKANFIEIISYNELAGRFEFQIVKDYRHGGTPRVFYANRAICTACHQNGGPIFSRRVWDETNANPDIASLLKQQRRDFYGIRVDRGVDIPQAIDDATDRANHFAAYQLLWREACGEQYDAATIGCRANLFTFMLQHRLTGDRQFDVNSSRYRRDFLPVFAANWERRWPGGIHIPDPDIPNRNPLLVQLMASEVATPMPDAADVLTRLVAQSSIRSAFEPLNPRPPLETWSPSTPGAIAHVISGLSESIAALDIRRLDEHLFERGTKSEAPRRFYYSACKFLQKTGGSQTYRLSFKCQRPEGVDTAGVTMEGRAYVEGGAVVRGAIYRITMADLGVVRDLEIAGGTVELRNGRWLAQLQVVRDGLHARRADGNAVESMQLSWRNSANGPRHRTTFPGDALVTVISDFSPIHRAIGEIAKHTIAGRLDAFSAKPFRRAVVMQALFAQLGMAPIEWCCADSADLPPASLDIDDGDAQLASVNADQGATAIKPFYRFCATCHRTRERFPPNFLYGDPSTVSANLAHCAERLYFRLSMWQLRPQQRPKSPMPPVHALHARKLSSEAWRDSAELTDLKHYVGGILKSQTGKEPIPATIIAREYEALRECLPATDS